MQPEACCIQTAETSDEKNVHTRVAVNKRRRVNGRCMHVRVAVRTAHGILLHVERDWAAERILRRAPSIAVKGG
jgi:hypothetical protein